MDKSEYLFVNLSGITKGQPLTKNGVNSAFGLLEKKTGIKVTAHMLRHYFANERRKRGKWSINRYSAVDVVTVNFKYRCYERHLLIRRQKTRGID